MLKLYSAPMPAPNPRRVRMVAAEKGIVLDEIMLDLNQRDHKAADHITRNALGQVPVLVLEDGTAISETVSICRYLDAIHPEPPLFGRTALEAALIDMWIRRIEIQLGEPTKMFWRHAHPATAALLTQYNDFGSSNRGLLQQAMSWFDRELSDGRMFVVGDVFTMADIAALTIVDFAELIGMAPLADGGSAKAWHARVASRPACMA